MTAPDVIVVGLGVAGSAIARELARRGRRVLGLERGAPAHDLGSSGGESRMLRDGGPEPRADVLRARALWRDLEAEAGAALFLPTGTLQVAAPGCAPAAGQLLDATALRRRVPALAWRDDARAALDEDAGVLLAEPCLRALHDGARRAGAELRFGVEVARDGLLARWAQRRVVVAGGEELHAGALVVAVGPWAAGLVPGLTVERVASYWLDPAGVDLAPAHTPLVVWDDPHDAFCMFPALPRGLKVGFQHGQPGVDPDALRRDAGPDELARARAELRARTGLDLPVRAAWISMYTHTPDGAFLVAPVDDAVVVSACGGRGFKFAPLIAERAAALV